MRVSIIRPHGDVHTVVIVYDDRNETWVYHFTNVLQLMGRVLSDRGKNAVPADVAQAIIHATGIHC